MGGAAVPSIVLNYIPTEDVPPGHETQQQYRAWRALAGREASCLAGRRPARSPFASGNRALLACRWGSRGLEAGGRDSRADGHLPGLLGLDAVSFG